MKKKSKPKKSVKRRPKKLKSIWVEGVYFDLTDPEWEFLDGYDYRSIEYILHGLLKAD